jgi:hypothetical protein
MSPHDDETHLSERICNLLEEHLFAEMTKHIPDDERVGIHDGAYWIGREPRDKTYVGVDHELPVFNRNVGAGDCDRRRPRPLDRGLVHLTPRCNNSRRRCSTTWGSSHGDRPCNRGVFV